MRETDKMWFRHVKRRPRNAFIRTRGLIEKVLLSLEEVQRGYGCKV